MGEWIKTSEQEPPFNVPFLAAWKPTNGHTVELITRERGYQGRSDWLSCHDRMDQYRQPDLWFPVLIPPLPKE